MKIGLTQRVLFHKGRAYDSIEHGWYSCLKEHTLSFVQNRLDQDFNTLADGIDALIITGGDDSPIRRVVETKLATAMLTRQKPIVGICHGCFLLTHLLGGAVTSVDQHMDTEHLIFYQGRKYNVNSYHTLCIEQIPSGAINLVQDLEGKCEAWIDNKIAGIVWHPERMDEPFIPEEIKDLLC